MGILKIYKFKTTKSVKRNNGGITERFEKNFRNETITTNEMQGKIYSVEIESVCSAKCITVKVTNKWHIGKR